MSSNNAAAAAVASFSSASSSLDDLFIHRFMNQLQLRPPYLDTNSFLSHRADDFFNEDDFSDEDDDGGEIDGLLPFVDPSGGRQRRPQLAEEEAELEKEIIRIINSGGALETLMANSGQSVSVGEHSICIGSHVDPVSQYRIWEWHGHIMFFDDSEGLSAEYIYGNYFERLPPVTNTPLFLAELFPNAELVTMVTKDGDNDGDGESSVDEEETEVDRGGSSGLRDLIEDFKDAVSGGVGGGRILHRNNLNAAAGSVPK